MRVGLPKPLPEGYMGFLERANGGEGFIGQRYVHLWRAEELIEANLVMRKLPLTAPEELLEIIMRRYERASTILTSNRPVEDWGELLGDAAAVSAMLDRLLRHGHVLKCGPRSWRTKLDAPE